LELQAVIAVRVQLEVGVDGTLWPIALFDIQQAQGQIRASPLVVVAICWDLEWGVLIVV